MTQLLRDWLAGYDPIHRGWTRAGIANGVCTTCGFCFPRIRGGYNLYRTPATTPNAAPVLVGAAGADASQIHPFGWIGHAPSSEYVYRLVPVSGGGIENWVDLNQVKVAFSVSGQWIGSLPNAPTDLQLIPLSYGRFRFRWSYYPHGQEAEPAGFYLYSSAGGDAIDYGITESEVACRPGQVHYEHVTRSEPDGARIGWAVRAYNRNRREEQNTHSVFALTRTQGPPANPVVHVSVISRSEGQESD